MSFSDKVKKIAADSHGELVQMRRHLHMNPELSFEEFNTSAYIASVLQEYKIPFKEKIAGTGIVAHIEGKNPAKKVVALRADMDALPIMEANDVSYRSKVDGVMHACGHDVHTTCLLGAAKILKTMSSEFEGTIKLIFQPGEEKLPGGASLLIKEGVLKNPNADLVLGQHVMPFIDTGKVGFRSGIYMASTDEIYVKVRGRGGHAATPHLNIDPVLVTAQILVALQQVVSRFANPTLPSVLSFGKVIANGATNVIPDEVLMEGTFRTLDEEWRMEAHRIMKKMAEDMASSMGAVCEFRIVKGYPVLINDVELTKSTRAFAEEYLGKSNVEDLDIWMAAEDFAFYTHVAKSCFYRLGTRNKEKGITSSVHTPTFDIDENALETGSGLMAYLALMQLEN